MDSMFDKALYYPTIEIKNEGWLKSAILFWNRIETLVPENMDGPYKKHTECLLEEAGLLYPHRIDPYSSMTDGLEDDILTYMRTKEGLRSLTSSFFTRASSSLDVRYGQKRNALEKEYGAFYDKVNSFSDEVKERINRFTTHDGSVSVGRTFMHFYMTLLANRICQQNDMVLLTERVVLNDLSSNVLLAGMSGNDSDADRQGVVCKVVLEGIKLDPSTPVESIIRFKEDRADLLEQLRRAVSGLVVFDGTGMTAGDIEETVKRQYSNAVMPVVSDLQSALTDAALHWYSEKSAYTMSGVVSCDSALDEEPNPVVVGENAEVILTPVRFRPGLSGQIENKPYTFLLKTGRVVNR